MQMWKEDELYLRQLQLQLQAQKSGHPTSETRFAVGSYQGSQNIDSTEILSGGETKLLNLRTDRTR